MLRALLVAALLALAGCSSAPPATAPTVPATPPPPSAPALLTVPALDLSAPLARTGLDPQGGILEPDVNRPETAAWVDAGPVPGEVGRAVIVGHVNGAGRPGVFADLATIPVGGEIRVTDTAGRDRRFVVREVSQWDKGTFPKGKVYGDTTAPALALVTCGGTFDTASGHYRDNIIVFADSM